MREIERKENLSSSLSSMSSSLGIELEGDRKVIIVYFNSECDHCDWEIRQIGDHFQEFRNTKVVFVSLEPYRDAIEFLERYGLQEHFIPTNPEMVARTFIGGVPQIYIYEDGNLMKKFIGEVRISLLLELID